MILRRPLHLFSVMCMLSWLALFSATVAAKDQQTQKAKPNPGNAMQCVAFSPYVDTLNPNYGAHPSRELIDTLLDRIVQQTPFRCIMTYGVLNGLEYTFEAARKRDLKVIAIIWLDKDIAVNSQSISSGIEVAKAFTGTIVKLSCGSEVRTRHNFAFDGEISRCISALREAGVKQPITTIDTWWEWCNRSRNCHITNFGQQVDWIGINIFPWWENRHADSFKCTPANKAADFHVARLQEVQKTYPGKEVIITEFGWPNGPEGKTEQNKHSGKTCGIASAKNQALVLQQTFKKMAKLQQTATAFAAFAEFWKPDAEGSFGSYWGLCQGKPPFDCASFLHPAKPKTE